MAIKDIFKKDVYIDLYTIDPQAYYYSQWQYAGKNKPAWWKNLRIEKPKIEDPIAARNMKHCAGFNHLYENAFLIPLWSDVMLEIGAVGTGQYRYQFADRQSKMDFHAQHQRGDWLPDDQFQHLKFESPWHIKCTHDIKFLMTTAEYEKTHPNDVQVLNGVVDYSLLNGSDVNLFVRRGAQAKELMFKKDDILAMVIPLTERKVKMRHHLLSRDEMIVMESKEHPNLSFLSNVTKVKQCPFRVKE